MPSGAYMDIIARLDTAPGNSPDFVKGLKLLQRRDRVLKVVQKGQGSIGNDQPVGPAYGADWCKEANDRSAPYDPDKAKFHLKKSGVTSAELDVAEVWPRPDRHLPDAAARVPRSASTSTSRRCRTTATGVRSG